MGFGVTFPAMLIAAGASRLPLGPAREGLRDGALAARRDAERAADSMLAGARDVLAAPPKAPGTQAGGRGERGSSFPDPAGSGDVP